MRILQVGKYYPPYRGGMETVLQSLCNGLVRFGHDVSVYCSNDSIGETVEENMGVHVKRFATLAKFSSQPFNPKMYQQVKKVYRRFDVIHIHSPNPLAEYACLSDQVIQPLVVTYHSDIVRQRFLNTFYSPLQRKFLDKCSRIVVASEQIIDHSPVLPFYRNKIEVIPFGIEDLPNVTDEKKQFMKDELAKKFSRYILFVGRLVEYKGIKYLIEAMKSIDSHLVIVGQGPLEFELKDRVAHLGLKDKVTFLGGVDSDIDLYGLYRNCEMFVLPSVSRAEAFGMVMLEAMAHSRPVVSTLLDSGARFVNQDGISGLQVEPSNSQQLSDAINKILMDSNLQSALSAGAFQRYSDLFQINRMIDNYCKVYEEVTRREVNPIGHRL